jgi:hypothetical protein
MMEPRITWGSWLFYRMFHDEPVDMTADPYEAGLLDLDKDLYDANQAIPTPLFQGHARQAQFEAAFPDLAANTVERLACIAYPLSDRFRPWFLIARRRGGRGGGVGKYTGPGSEATHGVVVVSHLGKTSPGEAGADLASWP